MRKYSIMQVLFKLPNEEKYGPYAIEIRFDMF